MTADSFAETSLLTTPGSVNKSVTAWVVIPSLTKTLGPRLNKFTNHTEDGYPMAAAPHQSVKIKVYFRDEFPAEILKISLIFILFISSKFNSVP